MTEDKNDILSIKQVTVVNLLKGGERVHMIISRKKISIQQLVIVKIILCKNR